MFCSIHQHQLEKIAWLTLSPLKKKVEYTKEASAASLNQTSGNHKKLKPQLVQTQLAA